MLLKYSCEMIFEMIAHAIAEEFRRAVFKNSDEAFVGYKFPDHRLFLQKATVVHIIKYRQEHFLKFLQSFISGDLIKLPMESDLMADIKEVVFCGGRFVSHNFL